MAAITSRSRTLMDADRARAIAEALHHGQRDLADRMRNPAMRPDGWSPPYERGLQILKRAASGRRPNLSPIRGGGGP